MDSNVVQPANSKQGFGLVEALAAMFILALMAAGVGIMNYTNHYTAMRIAARTEATQIGQSILDSLEVQGVANVVAGDTFNVQGQMNKARIRNGSNASSVTKNFSRTYRVQLAIDSVMHSEGVDGTTPINLSHVRSRNISLKVMWTLNTRDTNFITLHSVVQ